MLLKTHQILCWREPLLHLVFPMKGICQHYYNYYTTKHLVTQIPFRTPWRRSRRRNIKLSRVLCEKNETITIKSSITTRRKSSTTKIKTFLSFAHFMNAFLMILTRTLKGVGGVVGMRQKRAFEGFSGSQSGGQLGDSVLKSECTYAIYYSAYVLTETNNNYQIIAQKTAKTAVSILPVSNYCFLKYGCGSK